MDTRNEEKPVYFYFTVNEVPVGSSASLSMPLMCYVLRKVFKAIVVEWGGAPLQSYAANYEYSRHYVAFTFVAILWRNMKWFSLTAQRS